MSARTEALVSEVVIASRPLGDLETRETVIGKVLDVIGLELVGVDSLGELADRLDHYALALRLDHRDIEAAMVVAASRIVAA